VRRIAKYLLDLVRGFFLSGPGPVTGVVYALMPPGAVALGLALGSTMQVDLGMSADQIAKINLAQTISSAAGCVVGGWVSDRLGHRKMLGVWVALTTLPTLWLASRFTGAEGMAGVTLKIYAVASISYSFVGGLIFGTSTAVYMGLTSPIVAATQFSGYMALINFVYAYSSAWQGAFAEAAGYARTLRIDAMLAVVPLLLLPFLRPASREVLTGDRAAGRLTRFAAVFLLLSPAVASFRTDWGLPPRDTIALWVVAVLAFIVVGRRARRTAAALAASAVVAAVATALLAARCGSMVGTGIVPFSSRSSEPPSRSWPSVCSRRRDTSRRRSNGCASPRPRRPCPARSRRRGRVDTTICGSDLCPAAVIDRGAGSHTNASF
jgi:MFS family permease